MNIQSKQFILENLIEFFKNNDIVKSNIEDNKEKIEDYLSKENLGMSAYIPGVYQVYKFDEDNKENVGKVIYYNGKNGGWGFKTNEFSLEKQEEGKVVKVSDEINVNEVSEDIPKGKEKVSKEDITFEEYKELYKGQIEDTCNEVYGTTEDNKLLNDIAREMFLKSKYYIPNEEELKPEKIEENKKLEEIKWDSEGIFINGWHLEEETTNGGITRYWLYNPKGLGGSLIIYPDTIEELNEYLSTNKQVIGFEGNYLPKTIYNKIIALVKNGTIKLRGKQEENKKLEEADTDINNMYQEYKDAYNRELDLKRVPCVIAIDKFLSGWGGAEGKRHYIIVLCADSAEAHNIASNMQSKASEEGLKNVRVIYGAKAPSGSSVSYCVGRNASAWNMSDSWYERYDKKEESKVSDYTLKEIQKVLDSDADEYGYTIKIVNADKDIETKTLDIDKEDLKAIYKALSKKKVTEGNIIPRNWKKITYKAKTQTSLTEPNDIVEVEKDEFDRPIAKNTRTNNTAQMNWNIVRNPELAEIINVEKIEETKKVEAKFKDKVKAIKKSLKAKDKRLSDKTAEDQAEKIAGSMIKNESKENQMTFGEFKDKVKEIYNNEFPNSACTIDLGALGKDTFFITWYLAGNKDEFPNGISQNDLFRICFYLKDTNKNPYDKEHTTLTDDTIMPESLTMELNNGASILVKPDNNFMAYGSVNLPFRKTTGTPEKILSTLSKYANKLHIKLEELLKNNLIPEDRVELVKSKL